VDAVKAPLVLILLGFPSSDARVRSVTGCLRKRSSCKVALGNYVLPVPVAATFIPIFFIVTGFLIDPLVFFHTIIGNFALASAVLLALLVGKWIAAEIAGRAFHYAEANKAV
jgi:Kef-type K+ transport system membrane component KefB